MTSVTRCHSVVIGAGQAGLATGYHLAKRGVDFLVVDAATRVGESWRNRWDSLKLFTPAVFNGLPGMPFPTQAPWYYPTKDETAGYLEAYAARFSLPVELGVRVERVRREGDQYVVTTTAGRRIEARNVVVATGPFQTPKKPAFADQLSPSIRQMHSVEFRNAGQLADGPVLVVGAASSGCEIAVDLAKARKVYLAGRDVKSIPPLVRRTVLRWIATRDRHHPIGRKLHAAAKAGGGNPLIGFGYKRVTRAGVERVPRMTGVRDGRPEVEGGRVLDVANVIWSTGFTIDFSWIDLPVFEQDGYPRHERGVVESEPGLYFVGLVFLHSVSSQLLLGISRDSEHVVDQLVRRDAARPAAPAAEPAPRVGGRSA